MSGVLAQLRAVPIEPEVSLTLSGYHPLLVLQAAKLNDLLWPEIEPGGPYAADERELTPEEAATKHWTRLLVVAAAGLHAGAFPWTLVRFDNPRRSLGGQSLFEACRTEAGFVRALGLAHATGGADPEPGSRDEALLGDLETLLTVDLPNAPENDRLRKDIDALARRMGGRPQAAVIFACHRWGSKFRVSTARGTTLYQLAKASKWRTVASVLKAYGA